MKGSPGRDKPQNKTQKINQEAHKLQQKEDEIIKKAKQVENEMKMLKQEKTDLLLKVYKDQLMQDFESDLQHFSASMNQELEQQKSNTIQEKKLKIEKLDKVSVTHYSSFGSPLKRSRARNQKQITQIEQMQYQGS